MRRFLQNYLESLRYSVRLACAVVADPGFQEKTADMGVFATANAAKKVAVEVDREIKERDIIDNWVTIHHTDGSKSYRRKDGT